MVDLGAGLVVVAAWMLMAAKCGLLCRESSTILQRELNSNLLNKNIRSLSAAHAFFSFSCFLFVHHQLSTRELLMRKEEVRGKSGLCVRGAKTLIDCCCLYVADRSRQLGSNNENNSLR